MHPYAVIFPGQGSQSVGMLSEVAADSAVIQTTFAEASTVLGYDLWALVQQGPAEKLDQTVYTQPALLTASVALWRLLKKQGLTTVPVAFAGHSLGEYSALVASGALVFSDAVRLVAARGRYMQEAVPVGEGALGVIVGLDDSQIETLCRECAEHHVLSPANFNSPGQTVVAGHKDAVERAILGSKSAGAKLAKLLAVSVPSHCALMKPAAESFKTMLAGTVFKPPEVPVVNNVDACCYDTAESIRDGLVRQLYSPVQWVKTVLQCHQMGAVRFFECGPNKVLTGLGKRILPAVEWLSATDRVRLLERG